MPVNPDSIDAFLRRPVPYLPEFKGADPDWLRSVIFDITGKPYKPRTAPRKHQLEGVAFALYQRRCLLYYSMRLGKTKMSLDFAEQLRLGGQWRGKGIVICHAPLGLDVWQSEAEKHSRLKLYPVRNQLDELLAGLESDADLLVIPWSGLQNIFTVMRPTKKGINKRQPDYEAVRIVSEALSLCIIDEIHTAKNVATLRFKLAKELIRCCSYRLGLTGTPFGNDPFGAWAECYLIDNGETLGFNYEFFQNCFGTRTTNYFSGRREFKFDKKKQPLFKEWLSTVSLPYKLEECVNLTVMTGVVDLHIHGDQEVAYQQCITKLIELDDKQTVEIQATFTRLRQISSGYLPFIDDYGNELTKYFKTNVKAEWLTEFLDEIGEDLPSTLIFHEFTPTGQTIVDVLEKAGISYRWLHGDTKDKPLAVRDFQTHVVKVLVVQSSTGGMGIDLSAADYMLIYESSVSPIVRAQVEARPLSEARGKRPLVLDDLTCSGVEGKVLEFIRTGKSLMTSIVHDREWLRERKSTDGIRSQRRAPARAGRSLPSDHSAGEHDRVHGA